MMVATVLMSYMWQNKMLQNMLKNMKIYYTIDKFVIVLGALIMGKEALKLSKPQLNPKLSNTIFGLHHHPNQPNETTFTIKA